MLPAIKRKLGRACVLHRLNVDGTGSRYHNEVWVANDLVVRIARLEGDDGLLYERRLARGLPEEVCYPKVLGSGRVRGRAWLATQLVGGEPLALAWPGLDSGQKAKALWSIVEKLDAIHNSSPGVVWEKQAPFRPVLFGDDIFEGLNPAVFTAKLERLERFRHITPDLGKRLKARYDTIRGEAGVPQTFDDKPCLMASWPGAVPVHNDAHLGNFLWDGTKVTATLDFELAGYGPPDVDAFCAAISIGWLDPSFVPDDTVLPAWRALLGNSESSFKRYGLLDLVRGVHILDKEFDQNVDLVDGLRPTKEYVELTKGEAWEAIASGNGFFDRNAPGPPGRDAYALAR